MLNKQSRKADRGDPPASGFGRGADNSPLKHNGVKKHFSNKNLD